jgi:hypothetical protein
MANIVIVARFTRTRRVGWFTVTARKLPEHEYQGLGASLHTDRPFELTPTFLDVIDHAQIEKDERAERYKRLYKRNVIPRERVVGAVVCRKYSCFEFAPKPTRQHRHPCVSFESKAVRIRFDRILEVGDDSLRQAHDKHDGYDYL